MKYEKPIEIFEDTGKAQLENNLLKFNAKVSYFNIYTLKFYINFFFLIQ